MAGTPCNAGTTRNWSVTPREAEASDIADASQVAWTELTASILLFLYPILLLTVREGVNVCFTLLVILAFYSLFTGKASFRDLNRGEIACMAAMASLVVATALSQLWHWHFRLDPYDGASRFLLAIPVYLLLRSCRPQTLAAIEYGVPVGAIAAALVVLPQLPLADGARASTAYMDAIRFGDLALVLGVLSIGSVNANQPDPPWIIVLKVAGAAAGLFASIESGTRGGWIALPPVVLIWWVLLGREKLSWRLNAWLAGVLIVFAVVSYFFIGKVHDRVGDLYADVAELFHADLDTSLGERIQIWRVALQLIAENPVFGIGPDEFRNVLPAMKDFFTSVGFETAHAEIHSEILLRAVSLGIFGFASIVAIYAAPLIFFIRAAGRPSGSLRVRSAGVMGACFVTCFLIFGLTVEIFNLKMIATFYGMTIAVFLAAAGREAPT
jgi:O-antigen ligase